MNKRFLSGRDFEAALALFKERGIGIGELCKLLECANNQGWRWREIGAPRYIALALAAILRNLKPWQPTRSMMNLIDKKERVRADIRKMGSQRPRSYKTPDEIRRSDKKIAALRRIDLDLEEIGSKFGLGKERVRQICGRKK
jgi:hypothetical protein